MTIQWGDTGRTVIGNLKTFNITVPTPREDDIATTPANFTTNLPIVQDASVGVTFQIQSSDLPIITPSVPMKYCAIVLLAGRNTSGASANVTTQAFKNSVAVPGSSTPLNNITNNNYWTHSVHRFPDVTIGDILNVQVFASAANVTYDYCALMVYPTQILPYKQGTILKDLAFSSHQFHTLSKGVSPTASNTQGYAIYVTPTLNFATLTAPSNFIVQAITPVSNFNLYRTYHGDLNQGTTGNQHATAKPNYYRNYIPTTISFREVLR